MCILKPYMFACGHRHGYKITGICTNAHLCTADERAAFIQQHNLEFPNYAGRIIMKSTPHVCPNCFRAEEQRIHDVIMEKVRELEVRIGAVMVGGIGDSGQERPAFTGLAKDVQKKATEEIRELRKEYYEQLKAWRDENQVWGDG